MELDLYMFEEVCKLIERWYKAGRKIIPISVNLSRSHFEIRTSLIIMNMC